MAYTGSMSDMMRQSAGGGPGVSASLAARGSANVSLPSRDAAAGSPSASLRFPGGFAVSSAGSMGDVAPILLVLVGLELAVLIWGRHVFRNYHGG